MEIPSRRSSQRLRRHTSPLLTLTACGGGRYYTSANQHLWQHHLRELDRLAIQETKLVGYLISFKVSMRGQGAPRVTRQLPPS